MELRDIKRIDYSGNWDSDKETINTTVSELFNVIEHGVQPALTKKCKDCEYGSDVDGRNGIKECWKSFDGKDMSALDLYYGGSLKNNRAIYLDQLIEAGTLSLLDIDTEVLTKGKAASEHSGWTIHQLLQIEAARDGQEKVNLDVLQKINEWQFPLLFIDFETYTGAIPFHRLMRPYEIIAFQWSCHQLNPDGTLEHYEWINLEQDFPNFRFAESLMEVLGDNGTPLMWSHHENTVLRHILGQMAIHAYNNHGLERWLLSMTTEKGDRQGRLVDMAKICERSYVHPDCKGKVSIKKILPVIWNNDGNKDLHDHEHFKRYYRTDEKGSIMDPYKTLDPVKGFIDNIELEGQEVISEGTAAMKAYFELMYGKGKGNDSKKAEIKKLLLQYCKLDTLAMVIIYQYWKKLLVKARD